MLGFSAFCLSGIKPPPSAVRIKIYWAFRPAVLGETADCCCAAVRELVPKCGLYKPALTTSSKTKTSQIYSPVSVLCWLNLCSNFHCYLLLSWTFISVETIACTESLKFQGVMQNGLRDASEVFYPYQCAILRVKPGTSQSTREARRSPLLCVGFYGHRCGLHCLEHKLFVLIYKLKIKLCLFASLEGSFAHSCLKSEL